MTGIVLSVVYTLLFILMIWKFPFFRLSGLSFRFLSFAFLAKILAGFGDLNSLPDSNVLAKTINRNAFSFFDLCSCVYINVVYYRSRHEMRDKRPQNWNSQVRCDIFNRILRLDQALNGDIPPQGLLDLVK